ncbi:MAG: hypothetical protein MJ060_05205, partial [Clostridia bacterium]|nr:hypothetical protein [Clostridia bacterium]
SEITQGIREGLDNAYAFSSAINGDLANSLDNISSASLKMKNQAGSAFGELLRAVEPAIIKISQLVTDLADMISRLIAMFNGSSTYLQAQDVETTWNDGTKAVKEYKKQPLGLDELNVLNNQKSNSGSAIPNTKKMFKEVAVDSGIDKGTFAEMQRAVSVVKEAVSNIVDLIKSPEFKKLASLVGTILKESFILAIGTIGDVAKLVKSVLSGDWEASLDTILGWGEKASNFIDNLGGKIFGEKWEEYKTSLGNFVGDLQEKIGKVFDPETWKSTFKSITDSLSQALLNVFNNEFAVDLFDFFGVDIRPWLQTLKPTVKLPEGSELVTNTATANKNTGIGAWNKYGVYEGNYKKDAISQQSSEWYENYYGNKT